MKQLMSDEVARALDSSRMGIEDREYIIRKHVGLKQQFQADGDLNCGA